MEYKFHTGDRGVVVDTTAGAHDMESIWLGEKGVVLSVDCSVRPDNDFVCFVQFDSGITWWCCEAALDCATLPDIADLI